MNDYTLIGDSVVFNSSEISYGEDIKDFIFKVYVGTLFGISIYASSKEDATKLREYLEGYFPNDYIQQGG